MANAVFIQSLLETKTSERLLVGVEECNKQKWNIKVQYISIVIIFERHTPVQVFREEKNKQFKTMWLSTEPSRQHQPPDWCQS